MFELSEEETLMTSSDKTVVLTNHRVILYTEKSKQQVMVKDIVSYEVKKAHIGNYKGLMIVFFILTLLSVWSNFDDYREGRGILSEGNFFEYLRMSLSFKTALFFLTLSFFFFLLSRRYMLRINGKFNHIEFRVRNPGSRSLGKFLQRLIALNSSIREKKQEG